MNDQEASRKAKGFLPFPLESAVQHALTRVKSEAGLTGRDTDGVAEIQPTAIETAERRILRESGWTLEVRGSGDPPRPMAQLGAAEVDRRRVVLYDPFLRWIASRVGGRSGPRLLPAAIVNRIRSLPLEEREAWVRVAVLSHELFHVLLDRENRGDSCTGGELGKKDMVEHAAEVFATGVVVSAVCQCGSPNK